MRPRDFDEAEVLDRALLAFWRAGYDGCGISDLLAATGLQRQSLYNAFGDKQGLFVAALARYRHHVAAGLAPLAADTADLGALRRYIEGVLASQKQRGVGGCLIVKTALGQHAADDRIRAEVEAGASAVREAFARVLGRTADRGELAPGTDTNAAAAYLYVVLQGLSALASTGGSARQIASVLGLTFASIAKTHHPRKARP